VLPPLALPGVELVQDGQRCLATAIERAKHAAAKFYTEREAPEEYEEALAGVEVKPEPISRDGLVLSTYLELKSIRKTAVRCGLSKSTVQRLLRNVDAA